MSQIDVSIVMPCLNERRTLPHCIQMAREAHDRLKEMGYVAEILISDNGSDDGSVELAEELGCRVTHCPRRGYGSALIHGCTAARGRYIIMGDSDGSYDFRESVPMVERLEEGYDLCMGNRFKGGIKDGAMPWKNRFIGNPALSGILNMFFRTGLGDAHSGLRGISKEAFQRMGLSSPGMEFASEMVVKASLMGLRTTEVPITLSPDGRDRKPHLRPWRDGWRHLRFLLLLSPLWLFFVPSLTMLAVSLILFVCLMTTPSSEMFVLGPLRLGDHWMVLAAGLFNLGLTGLTFGMVSFRYSVLAGYRSRTSWLARVLDGFLLERSILVGTLFTVVGFAVLAHVVGVWFGANFGGLARVREMVLGTTLVISGFQVVLGAFLLALFHEEYRPYELTQNSIESWQPAVERPISLINDELNRVCQEFSSNAEEEDSIAGATGLAPLDQANV